MMKKFCHFLFLINVFHFYLNGNEGVHPPNFVFILVDDLGWQDVGFMGSDYFETPHIDELSHESMVFNQAYMYPTCSPSRTALLTGKQSFRTGVYTVPVLEKGTNKDNIFSKWTVDLEHEFYSQPLNKAGYKLIHLGKWHVVGPDPKSEIPLPLEKKLTQYNNGDFSWVKDHKSPKIQAYYPLGKGFHENVGGTWWGDPARGKSAGYNNETGGYVAPYGNPFIEEKASGEWLTDRLTSEAIDFMDRHKEGPFFVNLNYYAVHRPTISRSKRLLEKYKLKTGDIHTGQGVSEKDPEVMAAYASMVESVDDNVGRIIDFLNKSGLRENTVIIFTSDNGHNNPSHTKNLRAGKGTVYEGGIRVPALVNWGNKIQAGKCDVPIQGLDYFPTLLELAKINDYKGKLDGNSLVPLLKGKKLEDRSLFWHIASRYKNDPCSIVRNGKWKLIQFLLDGKVELYDLEEDQIESRNLANSMPEKVEELVLELTLWRRLNQVPLPLNSILKE